MSMFCYQCEQTAKGTGCTMAGVCGKDADTAALQDLVVHAAKGLGVWAHRAAQKGWRDDEVNGFVLEALFSTLTNVNFNPAHLAEYLQRAARLLAKVRAAAEKLGVSAGGLPAPASWRPAADLAGLIRQGHDVTIEKRIATFGPDVSGLQELLTYGLKGLAAYAYHARLLGREDANLYAFVYQALDFLAADPADIDALVGMCLRCGEVNLRAMEILDEGHTATYGHPQPTKVRVTPVKGKALLVSGHDLLDLEAILKQTAGKGVNVYTHGEMLPAHGYPGLKKYPHLVGNYGGAWQDQRKEFDAFPGAIVMTTNCLQKPQDSYKSRVFTCGPVGWPGVTRIKGRDFTPAVNAALAAPGFAADGPEKTILVGFARHAVLGVADKVIEAVKSGKIRHFFLVGGCDGAKPGRNYYTEFAQAVPKDCVILTLACGKYRFNKLDFGDIGGIPRLLDVGQCNDAYSAVQIALALAKAFNTDVNHLPLSLILSWYEQKAVVILLSLLHLGIQNMRIGPSLPAFVGPAVLNVLVDKFKLTPISTPQADLKAILG